MGIFLIVTMAGTGAKRAIKINDICDFHEDTLIDGSEKVKCTKIYYGEGNYWIRVQESFIDIVDRMNAARKFMK